MAYNAKAGMYDQVVQKRGGQLREGFTIVKVRLHVLSVLLLALFGIQPECRGGGPGIGRGLPYIRHPTRMPGRWLRHSEITERSRRGVTNVV